MTMLMLLALMGFAFVTLLTLAGPWSAMQGGLALLGVALSIAGGLFAGVAGLIGGVLVAVLAVGIAVSAGLGALLLALLAIPLALLVALGAALAPVLLPVALLVGLVWLIVKASSGANRSPRALSAPPALPVPLGHPAA